MGKIPSIAEVCEEISKEYSLDIWLLDIFREFVHLYSPQHGYLSEKFLVPLERLEKDLPIKKRALLLYKDKKIAVYFRQNIIIDYVTKKRIIDQITEAVY